jgi:hypothetical protein
MAVSLFEEGLSVAPNDNGPARNRSGFVNSQLDRLGRRSLIAVAPDGHAGATDDYSDP